VRILLVDAYDSFTYIIDQYLRGLGADTEVVRSGTRPPGALLGSAPDAVVLGPGPGHPADSGHVELVHTFAGRVPLLGICLGHQAVGLAHGGRVVTADQVRHGKTSVVTHDGTGLYDGLGTRTEVARYHSLVVAEPLPAELEVTGYAADDGCVMSLRHRELPVWGVQFHPESVATTGGARLLGNFLAAARRYVPVHL
jgi:anthranilate synthase component 2